MTKDNIGSTDQMAGSMSAGGSQDDELIITGHFDFTCMDDRGKVLWQKGFDNLVTTVGKNALGDMALRSSAYTAANYMGLISSTTFTAVAVGDTMASHAGWLEAGNANTPHYTAPRPTIAYNAAAAGVSATTAAASFVFTGSGTVQGAFVDFGAAATNTIDNTGGILLSAGTLAAAQPVITGNTVTVTHTLTIS